MAGLTFLFTQSVGNNYYNSSASSSPLHWGNGSLSRTLNDSILPKFPSSIQTVITASAPIKKSTYNSTAKNGNVGYGDVVESVETRNALFIFSACEASELVASYSNNKGYGVGVDKNEAYLGAYWFTQLQGTVYNRDTRYCSPNSVRPFTGTSGRSWLTGDNYATTSLPTYPMFCF